MYIIPTSTISYGALSLDEGGSKTIASYEFGLKYNNLWLKECGQIDKNNQIIDQNASPKKNENRHQATAYMCNPNNWSSYRNINISNSYAVGGPTMELFIKSWIIACNKSNNFYNILL